MKKIIKKINEIKEEKQMKKIKKEFYSILKEIK